MDAVTSVPAPVNEPVLTYAPGTPERASIETALAAVSTTELPMTIGGAKRMASGDAIRVVAPHDHQRLLGLTANATEKDALDAVAATRESAAAWQSASFDDRAAVFLKAADLLAGPWRARINAATMLGQSKTVQQAEIDSACELVDFLRFNAHFARQILSEQPQSSAGVWNRTDHRPLEGFVYAITPFNFTAIAGNLPTAPALMGNTVVWKPSPTQQLAASMVMEVLVEAGLPDGVINMVTGDGIAVSNVLLADENLAGIHFTGSTAVFQSLFRTVAENITNYRGYPRIVGETGGKDFVLAHPSADLEVLKTALIRGAFEYQGQKCSAASRAYVPRSLWTQLRDDLIATTESLTMGDVADLRNFMGAVIDGRSFGRLSRVIERARGVDSIEIAAGGQLDDSAGYFVRPTLLLGTDPEDEIFSQEFFGPVLAVHVYDDADYLSVLAQLEWVSRYALTGSIIARDRAAIAHAQQALRFAAGNFYINDKPTGAVVGQQPFGGGRASGTNDKAGSPLNLLRWTSPRTIKETFVPAVDHHYPHMS